MRKTTSHRQRRPNVVQFRGQGPRTSSDLRRSRRGPSAVLLVLFGLLAGGALGLGVSYWMKAGSPGLASLGATDVAVSSLCIADVHDGDTIRTCDGERVRIENIDAPELPGSPKCEDSGRRGWCDFALAERSRNELASFLADGQVAISRHGTDRYDRTLATLSVDGRDAGDHLVSMGFAREWD